MTKQWKVFISSLVVIALALFPACRTKKQVQPQVQPPVVESQAPVVAPPPAPLPVEQPRDFVRTDTTVTEEPLPSNLEDLNRVAQEKGFIRDAFFGFDESTLPADAQSALSNSAHWLNGDGRAYNLLIEGHCDERGTEQYNLALGDKRANVAKEYLQTLGVDGSRIRTVSYGEERPFDPGHDESAWSQNRRAHLVLVGK